MCQDSPLPPTCLHLPRHSLSTGASREAPVDKRAHQYTKSSCSRIPGCRRLAYTCLDTHCQQVLRAKHLFTSAPTKTPIAHIIVPRKHKITTAQRAPQQSDNRKQHHIKSKRQTHRSTAFVGSSTKAACAAVKLRSSNTPLREHGARCYTACQCGDGACRCCKARAARCYIARPAHVMSRLS